MTDLGDFAVCVFLGGECRVNLWVKISQNFVTKVAIEP
jgi:hypothetical protein